MGNPSQSYGALPAVWDHTCHLKQVNVPLYSVKQWGTQFTYPVGMEGWVNSNYGLCCFGKNKTFTTASYHIFWTNSTWNK